jgi:catechol 2,3-dioxygenase-like lactoylglutathione lyase family enzyme
LISHVFVGVTDFQRAFQFYSLVMDKLGLRLKFCDPEKQWAGWTEVDRPRPLFLIGGPSNGENAMPGNGQMIALLAASRDVVERAYNGAIKNGGVCEGPPGLRPHYHPNYYGAYFRDPDGNKICVCCHDACPSETS